MIAKKKTEQKKINNTFKLGCQIKEFSENMKENHRSKLLIKSNFLKTFLPILLSFLNTNFI